MLDSILVYGGLGIGGMLVYLGMGSLTLLGYVTHDRINGRTKWFSASYRDNYEGNTITRWVGGKGIPPLAVMLGWPLFLPLAGFYGIWSGVAKLTEKAADKITSAVDKNQKRLEGR
jgi:hypothetical protein